MRTPLLLLVVLFAVPASAATYTVTKVDDTADGACDADCSLREAIVAANAAAGPDSIRFSPLLGGQTIQLSAALGGVLPTLTDDVVIDGRGLDIRVRGTVAAPPIFENAGGSESEIAGLTIENGNTGVRNRGTLTLRECTIRNGGVGNSGSLGTNGTLVIDRCTVSGNSNDAPGAGVTSIGPALVIRHSTISGNETTQEGAAVFIESGVGGRALIENSTITANQSGLPGSGAISVWTSGPAVAIVNSIVAGNTRRLHTTPNDCDDGVIVSGGHNVVGPGCPANGPGDVRVAAGNVFTLVLDEDLADNGGPTLTHALQHREDNPALDLGGSCGPVDQRGVPAPLDGPDADADAECDAGAVEADAPALAVTLTPETTPVVIPAGGGSFSFTAEITNTGTGPLTLQAWARAALPDGATSAVLFGPAPVTLAPGQTVTRTLTQQVPAGAPAGTYRYVSYVGLYPNGAVDGASFGVLKEGAAGRVASSVAWPPASEGAPDASGGASAAGPSSTLARHAARPNPFTDRTTLGFELQAPSRVRLAVYDGLGREVAVLVDREMPAGSHEAVLDGASLPAGTYLVRLEAGGAVETRRATLLR